MRDDDCCFNQSVGSGDALLMCGDPDQVESSDSRLYKSHRGISASRKEMEDTRARDKAIRCLRPDEVVWPMARGDIP